MSFSNGAPQSLSVGLRTAAQILDISVAKIRKDVSQGRLRAKRIGRKVVILRSDLEEYLQACPDWEQPEQQAVTE